MLAYVLKEKRRTTSYNYYLLRLAHPVTKEPISKGHDVEDKTQMPRVIKVVRRGSAKWRGGVVIHPRATDVFEISISLLAT